MDKICECCNTPFKPKKLATTRKDGYRPNVYCSRRCRSDAELKTRVYKNCLICNTEFWHWPAHDQKFCSHPCYAQSLVKSLIVPCAQCGKEFEKRLSAIKRTKTNLCSTTCNTAYKIGQNHPMYVNGKGSKPRGSRWNSVKKAIKIRDNYTCQMCHTHEKDLSKKQWRLEIHHIVPFGYFTDEAQANHPKNLITYCHVCHWKVERKTKPLRAKRQMMLFAA